jgi:hypothetical protein
VNALISPVSTLAVLMVSHAKSEYQREPGRQPVICGPRIGLSLMNGVMAKGDART